ncbi:TIGR03756 family integrating conjugative element protein [Gilliamella sp. Pas-s25]|uniref:TIGR03756 family integrating conjugative element protein n=1 Tax=Gilliamella sp. Pas-s25 TaxID=2687310 RepID=UPI00135E24F6|nr:TIGR03756 family integrating conjugative element protein [Gilliamella sp. Pas-s25]MWP61591.1 TIGR03756 family integrating conjugative element protein [Gilliamella sp. Pas-s25]
MIKKIKCSLLGLIITMPSFATSISTQQIVQSALSTSCTEYKIAGTCFWLFCSYGCKIRTSVKVKHYIPDVVMSAYEQPFENPWTEINAITSSGSSLVGANIQGGGDTNNRQANNRTKIRFKDVQAIGHPGGAVFSQMLSGMGYYCNNGVTPFYPYFVSELDFIAWRLALVESVYPEALIPGKREIGSSDMWGNIYPRAGAVTQNDDFKAGAVVVQRGADVLTNSNSLHVVQNYTKRKKDGFWPPAPVKENTNNHKWQELAPTLNMSCGIFPNINDTASVDGAYVYALWRPYACCKRRGQKFLYSIDFGG